MTTAVLWFRRDLRLADNPALVEAAHDADEVVAAFCLDEVLLGPAGGRRTAMLVACLRALDESIGGHLVVRRGDPVDVIPALAAEVDAVAVHAAFDFGPYGHRRDDAVAAALSDAGVPFVRTGSPYAIEPGTITTKADTPYRVFTPFSRAWRDHGWIDPIERPDRISWRSVDGEDLPPVDPEIELPSAGEHAAQARADDFLGTSVDRYHDLRDRPAQDATSRLSPDLKWGTIHPRQLLARLDQRNPGQKTFATELCWRDFYADVLWARPESARESLNERTGSMAWDRGSDADGRFEAWTEGRTGYPIVDAGMRQLLAESWMHNRVRMIVASFLVKDLHLDWQRGARWFMAHLIDGDLASNQHGWQWTAGTGTDAAPFFRIFNPTSQGKRFDPEGDYVRRWVDELAEVPAGSIHEPWTIERGLPTGYPERIVDHAEERAEALRRYGETKDS